MVHALPLRANSNAWIILQKVIHGKRADVRLANRAWAADAAASEFLVCEIFAGRAAWDLCYLLAVRPDGTERAAWDQRRTYVYSLVGESGWAASRLAGGAIKRCSPKARRSWV